MSDSCIDLVQLDATDDPDQAQHLQRWLRERAWTRAAEAEFKAPHPTTSESGLLRLTDALAPKGMQLLRNEPRGEIAVTITSGWRAYTATANYEPPACPACGERAEPTIGAESADPFIEVVGSWWETRVAPEHTCPLCDHRAVITDWNLDNAVACSSLAITAEMYGAENDLRQELEGEFGGQWATMHEHI